MLYSLELIEHLDFFFLSALYLFLFLTQYSCLHFNVIIFFVHYSPTFKC